jgi:transmembrane sensor
VLWYATQADRRPLAGIAPPHTNPSGAYLPQRTTVQPLLAQTGYGQRRTVRLPDGSVVTLNAHSTLTLSPDWGSGKREVTLSGEAFFRVSKLEAAGQPVKFTVKANHVAVEVLGTQFDVSTRNRRVKVVLNEGKIRLNILPSRASGATRTLDMLPGDMIEISDKQALTLKSRVETAEHTAWVTDELVFDNTSLAEVAEVIRNNYGYTVEFADPGLATQRLTATLPDPNLDVLLKALEKAFYLSVTKNQKTIRLAKSNHLSHP